MKKTSSILFILSISLNLFAQQVIPLYSDTIPNSIGTITEADKPTLTVYIPTKEKQSGTAVIIFPGGAYGFWAIGTEGTPIAQSFVEKGIAAFVVKYRLPKDETMRNKTMGPLMDAQQAVKYVRDHAKEYGIDNDRIGVIGYSAGGHLASSLGTHYHTAYIANKENTNLRPDFMILVYPVISMNTSLTHQGSRYNLVGNDPDTAWTSFFSIEKQVTINTPPTYLTHTGDDRTVKVENSIEMYKALQEKNVPAELHLYPKGDHGFTQRLPIIEWLSPMLLFLKKQGIYYEKIY